LVTDIFYTFALAIRDTIYLSKKRMLKGEQSVLRRTTWRYTMQPAPVTLSNR